MILKNDHYIWKINRDGYKSKFPYMFGDIDFENVFIAYDMYNIILKMHPNRLRRKPNVFKE